MAEGSFLMVGHTTHSSTKVWVRGGSEISFTGSWMILLEVYNGLDLVETQQYTLESKDSFGTHTFEIFGLEEKTYYRLKLKIYD